MSSRKQGRTAHRRPRWILAVTALAAAGIVGFALAQGAMGNAPARGTQPYGPGWPGGYSGRMQAHGPGWTGRGGGYGTMPYDGMGPWTMAPGPMGGYGMMGGYGRMVGGYGMMGGSGMMQVLPSTATPLEDAIVRQNLQRFADRLTAGAQLHDIMVFTNNVYAQVLDASGKAVGEILLDRYSGAVSLEPGPNMMWNTHWKMGGYGPGSGPNMMRPNMMRPNMMGPNTMGPDTAGPNAPSTGARLDAAAATSRANAFLAGYLPGASVVGSQTFPGYFTFDYGTNGTPLGMLSVNALTGQVWPHTWHGAFIREIE
ncbi:MAG: hypothetical protein P8Y13_03090 [Deinococcales bacterium]